ncbi:MAG: AraC family ligand binding domain-containing protein [Rhodanobacter sp.]
MFGKSEQRSDYQRTASPVVAMARRLQQGDVTPAHRHRRAQLIYAASGVVSVEAQEGIWIVPPERGVWIPALKRHGLRAASDVELHNVYVEPKLAAGFPAECAVVAVTPLLRALIGEAVVLPARHAKNSREARILSLLLESIDVRPLPELTLPMPSDPRALRMAIQVRAEPSVALGLSHYGDQAGASRRTLERLFREETGIPFGRWRQQALLCAHLNCWLLAHP